MSSELVFLGLCSVCLVDTERRKRDREIDVYVYVYIYINTYTYTNRHIHSLSVCRSGYVSVYLSVCLLLIDLPTFISTYLSTCRVFIGSKPFYKFLELLKLMNN